MIRLIELKQELVAAENHNLARRLRGKWSLNFGADLAEELCAVCLSGLEKVEWQLATTGTKGYDLFSELGRVEVKSVASMHRHIGNLKDKALADRICVIWFSENTLLKVDRVMLYDTEMIMSLVQASENKKGLLTHKMQKELWSTSAGVEITTEFQAVIDSVMCS